MCDTYNYKRPDVIFLFATLYQMNPIERQPFLAYLRDCLTPDGILYILDYPLTEDSETNWRKPPKLQAVNKEGSSFTCLELPDINTTIPLKTNIGDFHTWLNSWMIGTSHI